ncbi:hypothetical protein KM043_015653 [Ampulex compressa]|nr:hypothetical protein KM043_015653 [Ampulex compressa]
MRLNELHLTKFRLRFPYTSSTRTVRNAWEAADVNALWKDTMWAKKVEAKKKRAALSDFDRFKLRKARQIRNKLRTVEFRKLKKKPKPAKVLVDGPATGVARAEMRLNELHLTKFRLRFPYTSSTRTVRNAWEAADVNALWKDTMWAKKVEAKKKRAALSDFDRFKLRKARQIRNKLRTVEFRKLKKKPKPAKVTDASKESKKVGKQ